MYSDEMFHFVQHDGAIDAQFTVHRYHIENLIAPSSHASYYLTMLTRCPVAADSIAAKTIARLLILSWHSPIGVAPVLSACRKSRNDPAMPMGISAATSATRRSTWAWKPPVLTTTSATGAACPSHVALPCGPTARHSASQDVGRPSAHQLPR